MSAPSELDALKAIRVTLQGLALMLQSLKRDTDA
jgi:hypothetical protein